MTPQEEAKYLINKAYQPMGYLSCGVNNNRIWEIAKEITLDMLKHNCLKLKKNTFRLA